MTMASDAVPEAQTTPDPSADRATDTGDAPDAGDDVARLEHELAHAQDQWRRNAADLDNLQKRFRRELARGQASERERVLGAWIGSLDDLERAIEHEDDHEAFVAGVRSILERAVSSVTTFGYPRFGAPGDVFDPAIHEVVSTTPASETAVENEIVAVMKAGYGDPERLLRPALVVVATEAG